MNSKRVYRTMTGKKYKSEFSKLIGKRDPSGYFIIPARRQALKLLDKMISNQTDIIVEDVGGNIVLLKTKSRALAQKLLKLLESHGLTAYNEL